MYFGNLYLLTTFRLFFSENILLSVIVEKVFLFFFFGTGQRNVTLYLNFIHREALVSIIYGAAKTEIAQGLAL